MIWPEGYSIYIHSNRPLYCGSAITPLLYCWLFCGTYLIFYCRNIAILLKSVVLYTICGNTSKQKVKQTDNGKNKHKANWNESINTINADQKFHQIMSQRTQVPEYSDMIQRTVQARITWLSNTIFMHQDEVNTSVSFYRVWFMLPCVKHKLT